MAKVLMKVMDSSGDSRVEFDTAAVGSSEYAEAQALFSRLTAGGGRGFQVNGKGEGQTPIKAFEEITEGEVLLVPPLAGG